MKVFIISILLIAFNFLNCYSEDKIYFNSIKLLSIKMEGCTDTNYFYNMELAFVNQDSDTIRIYIKQIKYLRVFSKDFCNFLVGQTYDFTLRKATVSDLISAKENYYTYYRLYDSSSISLNKPKYIPLQKGDERFVINNFVEHKDSLYLLENLHPCFGKYYRE